MREIKHIVCLGGGSAMPGAVLVGLKKYPVKLSVISAVLDSGGSAGRLRKGFKTSISFGDIRRAVFALSEADSKTRNYFTSRDSDGHVMANIFCSAWAVVTGSPETAIDKFRKLLKVPSRHEILPATLDNAQLCASLENGLIIEGETNIDIPKHNGKLRIKGAFLEPRAKAYPKASEAIKKADLIVIGPGDLYSSLAQILLVEGISEAIRKSKAKKIYICNLMTKFGETNNFSVSDFVNEIEKLLSDKLDYVIYNDFFPAKERIKKYKKEHPQFLEMVKINENLSQERFIGRNLLPPLGAIVHDPGKIAKIILSLCKL